MPIKRYYKKRLSVKKNKLRKTNRKSKKKVSKEKHKKKITKTIWRIRTRHISNV